LRAFKGKINSILTAKEMSLLDLAQTFGQFPKREILYRDIVDKNAFLFIGRLIKTFFQITSAMDSQENLKKILELIVIEATSAVKAHRCTLFLAGEKGGPPSTRFSFAVQGCEEQSLDGELTWVQKIFQQGKPFLIGNPATAAESSEWREKDITSLMCIPLSIRGKKTGALSAILIQEEEYIFDEKSFEFFSIFANLATLAMKNSFVFKQLEKEKTFRISYECYLDAISNDLQIISKGGENFENAGLYREEEKRERERDEVGGEACGVSPAKGKTKSELRKDERIHAVFEVEFENGNRAFTKNLSKGGAFILTSQPMELEDRFPLKLFLRDGGGPAEVDCKVIWTKKYGVRNKLRKGMGVKFLNLQPQDQKRIEQYIQSHKP
jgi:uncharacterized protein (TIGR02266 family)